MKKAKHASAVPKPSPLSRDEAQLLSQLFNTGRYVELETRARLLVGLHPESGMVWKIFGTALLVQGKDALQALEQAATLLPNDVEAQGNLGNALRDAGRHEEAIGCYRRALALKLASTHWMQRARYAWAWSPATSAAIPLAISQKAYSRPCLDRPSASWTSWSTPATRAPMR